METYSRDDVISIQGSAQQRGRNESLELLKKVLATQVFEDAQTDDWAIGFREGIEHCINTLEAAEHALAPDASPREA